MFKRLGMLVLLGVMGVSLLLAGLWLEHRAELTLPSPSGPMAVGRATFAWVNQAQTDELAPDRGAKREVLAWIWYPASVSKNIVPGPYLPDPWRVALDQYSGVLMTRFLTRDSRKVRVHALPDAAVTPELTSYPVVLMRAGGGALTTDFTTLAEDLASHGYVVAGFDAPYRTAMVVFPDGRIAVRPPTANPENLDAEGQHRLINRLLPMWSSDAQFVVDQLGRLNAADPSGRFTGRLDMQRIGIFGHSFGGATALQFCHDDSRCKAGIDIDGAPYGSVVKDGLTQPFLFLLSDHGDLSAPEARSIFADISSIYDRLPNGRLLLFIRGANHFSFSDEILLKSQFVIKLLGLFQGGLDGRRGLAITTSYVNTFFDVYLKNAPTTRLDKLREIYPEVHPAKQ